MKCCVYTNDKIFINSLPRHMSTPVSKKRGGGSWRWGVVLLAALGVTVIVSQQAVAGHVRDTCDREMGKSMTRRWQEKSISLLTKARHKYFIKSKIRQDRRERDGEPKRRERKTNNLPHWDIKIQKKRREQGPRRSCIPDPAKVIIKSMRPGMKWGEWVNG